MQPGGLCSQRTLPGGRDGFDIRHLFNGLIDSYLRPAKWASI
jgi:hypothetical protein